MRRSHSIACAVIVMLTIGFSATAASASQPDRKTVPAGGYGDLPAGVACVFPVSLNPAVPYSVQQLTFFDSSGNVVRQVNNARPSTWKITNLDTDASYTFPVAAGRLSATPHDDGSTTVALSGGIVGFNAPTDTPPGPFTLSITGHLTLTVDADGNSIIIRRSGTVTDLCAKVAP